VKIKITEYNGTAGSKLLAVVRRTNMQLVIRSIFFTITLPGVGILLIPYLILLISDSNTSLDFSPVSLSGIILWIISFFCLLYCIWSFAFHGRGTLAPLDPPKLLVVQGLYQYTRNPMYLAVFGALISEALIFHSFGILMYSLIAFVLFHIFVVHYEEPKLLSEFGIAYDQYRQAIPRWGIKVQPYSPNSTN
jgi:protein-S-isoprenylcysteine O-methyltransferase Ste14